MADDGYSDITAGAQVAVSGPNGATLAVGPLSAGSPSAMDGGTVSNAYPDGDECVFSFSVPGVRDGLRTYGITVSHRGTLDYSRAQLRQPVTLKLGG